MFTHPIRPGVIVECVEPIRPLIRGQLYVVIGNSYGVGGWAVHVQENGTISQPVGNRYGWWPWRFAYTGLPHRFTNDRWMQDVDPSLDATADPRGPDQLPAGD